MSNSSRTQKVYINSVVTIISQLLQVVLGFVVRKIFINTLGVAYLGYNSVFTNILQMLNLADMGIGVAITGFLYEPIAKGNDEKLASLMHIYKRIYEIIGFIVLCVGAIISIFLPSIIKDAECSNNYLRILFFIHLAGTVSTYFMAYKRTLLVADQRSFITNSIDAVMFFVVSGLQIASLYLWPNYIIYLLLNICKTIISNVVISIICKKAYVKMWDKHNHEIEEQYKPQLLTYVKDVFISRLGAVVYYGTDNVIISIFKGSLLTGYLSNYTLLTTHIQSFINQLLKATQASYGSYINSVSDVTKQKKMTDNYLFVNYMIGNFSMICLLYLVQPFITLFFGEKLLLADSTVIWLSINLYLTILIQLPSQVFIIYKLFKYDRPIIATSAVLNISISAMLVQSIGLNGVLIGTFITSLIYLFSRFFIISKYVYAIKFWDYLFTLFKYFIVSTINCLVLYIPFVMINPTISKTTFILRFIIVVPVAILFPCVVLNRTNEYAFIVDKFVPKKVKPLFSIKILSICLFLILVLAIVLNVLLDNGVTIKEFLEIMKSRKDLG